MLARQQNFHNVHHNFPRFPALISKCQNKIHITISRKRFRHIVSNTSLKMIQLKIVDLIQDLNRHKR